MGNIFSNGKYVDQVHRSWTEGDVAGPWVHHGAGWQGAARG
jgi:hypothetical protein